MGEKHLINRDLLSAKAVVKSSCQKPKKETWDRGSSKVGRWAAEAGSLGCLSRVVHVEEKRETDCLKCIARQADWHQEEEVRGSQARKPRI